MRSHLARVVPWLSLCALVLAVHATLVATGSAQEKPASRMGDLAGKKAMILYAFGGELDETKIESVEALGLWTTVPGSEKAPRRIFIPWTAIKSVTLSS